MKSTRVQELEMRIENLKLQIAGQTEVIRMRDEEIKKLQAGVNRIELELSISRHNVGWLFEILTVNNGCMLELAPRKKPLGVPK